MFAFPSSRRALFALGLPAALALAACDDDSTGVVVTEFDPTAAAETVEKVVNSIGGATDALASLELAADALASTGTLETVLPGGSPMRLLPAAPTRLETISLAASSIFPRSILGKTFVYSTRTGRYEIDASLTGAPENGVRFIYYAIDPITRRPAMPLNARGYLELTDQSTANSTRLGIKAVNTTGATASTLIDYSIDASYVETTTSERLTLAAKGKISDGTKPVEFDLSHVFSSDVGSDAIGVTVKYALSAPGEGITLRFEASGEMLPDDPDGFALDMVMTVTAGSNTTVVDATIRADGGVNGTVTINKRNVAVIGGTRDNPTVTTPTGGNLTARELLALKRIWEAVNHVTRFGTSILSPFSVWAL
jgi:hypothetical protein